MEIGLLKKPLSIAARLSSKKIDLAPLTPKGEGGPKGETRPPPSKERPERIFSHDPLPLALLRQAEGAISFEAERILLPGLSINDLTVRCNLKKGRLNLELVKAAIGGGQVEGSLNLQEGRKTPRLKMHMRAAGIDLGRMLKEIRTDDLLAGHLDFLAKL